jgi:hypothetical protein
MDNASSLTVTGWLNGLLVPSGNVISSIMKVNQIIGA